MKIIDMQTPYEFTVPSRCETFRKIYNLDNTQSYFVPNQQLANGIFIPNCIISGSNPYIKILNTTSNNVTIRNKQIRFENLNNYNIFTVQQSNGHRNDEVIHTLENNFPKFVSDKLVKLCKEYTDIFALEHEQITANNFYRQKLHVKDPTPTYIKNYRIPYTQKEEIDRQINKLLKDDIIEPSLSEYNSPLLLVPKKSPPGDNSKKWRLVFDFRQVNKKLAADKYPLPRIDDILDQLGRAKYFSCLDLMSGFHQIELDEESRDLTSFSTNQGSFRFKRLPYGLKVAPNSFQRMMSLAFSGLKADQAFLYMDDLIVIGCSEKHMINNLRDVFETKTENTS